MSYEYTLCHKWHHVIFEMFRKLLFSIFYYLNSFDSLIFIDPCKSVKFLDMGREVIEDDVVKAIKYKLNNEEQGWRKQNKGLTEN